MMSRHVVLLTVVCSLVSPPTRAERRCDILRAIYANALAHGRTDVAVPLRRSLAEMCEPASVVDRAHDPPSDDQPAPVLALQRSSPTVAEFVPRPHEDSVRPGHPALVELHAINTGDSLVLTSADEDERAVESFFRCHHTGARHPIDHRLLELLLVVAARFPGKVIEIVSGYRHPRVARTPHSYHTRGQATDLRIPGISNEALRNFLATQPGLGVGYYPNSVFVHVDVRGGRGAYWTDVSGPGETPRYRAADWRPRLASTDPE